MCVPVCVCVCVLRAVAWPFLCWCVFILRVKGYARRRLLLVYKGVEGKKKIVVIVIKTSAPHSGYFANALKIFNVFFFQFLFPTQALEEAVSAAFHPATSSC